MKISDIDDEKVKKAFMTRWVMLSQSGILAHTFNSAAAAKTDEQFYYNGYSLYGLALAAKFYNPGLDPNEVWEKQASRYFETDKLREQSRWIG